MPRKGFVTVPLHAQTARAVGIWLVRKYRPRMGMATFVLLGRDAKKYYGAELTKARTLGLKLVKFSRRKGRRGSSATFDMEIDRRDVAWFVNSVRDLVTGSIYFQFTHPIGSVYRSFNAVHGSRKGHPRLNKDQVHARVNNQEIDVRWRGRLKKRLMQEETMRPFGGIGLAARALSGL